MGQDGILEGIGLEHFGILREVFERISHKNVIDIYFAEALSLYMNAEGSSGNINTVQSMEVWMAPDRFGQWMVCKIWDIYLETCSAV